MKYLMIISIALIASTVQAQTTKSKTIEIQGYAERTVTPDEIYVRITLKEYKSGSKVISMNSLESGVVKAIKKMDIDTDNLTVDNIYGYNWNWKKKKPGEYLATKSFRLKLADVKRVNDLIDKLDPEGLNSINLAEVSHSNIDAIKMELKAQALKNAKKKAAFLLGAIDEQLGSAVEIQEVNYGYQQAAYARSAYRAVESDANYKSNLEFKSIDIKSEFRVVFEIK